MKSYHPSLLACLLAVLPAHADDTYAVSPSFVLNTLDPIGTTSAVSATFTLDTTSQTGQSGYGVSNTFVLDTRTFNYPVATSYQTAANISCGKLLAAAATDPDYRGVVGVTSIGTPSNGTARLNSGYIIYTPQTGFSGNATIPVTLTDSLGNNYASTITVTVRPSPNAGVATPINQPELLGVSPGVSVSLRFHGIPQYNYQIQRSTDLSTWQTLTTMQAGADGTFLFTDTAPPQAGGFYRLSH